MKEELTTLMHMEFCRNEEERVELAVIGIEDEVFYHKSISFEDALNRYGISEKQFWENTTYKRNLSFPARSLSDLQKDYPNFTKEEHDRYKACKNDMEICFLRGELEKEFDENYKTE